MIKKLTASQRRIWKGEYGLFSSRFVIRVWRTLEDVIADGFDEYIRENK